MIFLMSFKDFCSSKWPNPRWWQQQWETAKEIFPKEAALETIEVQLCCGFPCAVNNVFGEVRVGVLVMFFLR